MGTTAFLIKEGLYNREFVDKWCLGFEEWPLDCENFTPEKTEEITGAPLPAFVAAARMYAKSPGSFAPPRRASRTTSTGEQRPSLLLIPLILGYTDRPGCAMFPTEPKGQQEPTAFGTHQFYDGKWWNAREQKDNAASTRTSVPSGDHMTVLFCLKRRRNG